MALVLALGSWVVAAGTLVTVWRASERRREAVARTAHELRGPLTAISLGLAVADREARAVGGWQLGAGGRRAALELELRRAQVALEDLDRLADRRSRTWRRPGAGGPRRLEAVALDELLCDSVAAWSAFAAVCGAELLPPPPTAEPAIVLGDPARLAQATGNLIANALEHGGGQVRARCRVMPTTVRVEISDRGAGLPAPVEILLGRRRRPRRRGGRRGHGLRVVAAVAAAHGGRLAAAPAEVGARLVLELPRHER